MLTAKTPRAGAAVQTDQQTPGSRVQLADVAGGLLLAEEPVEGGQEGAGERLRRVGLRLTFTVEVLAALAVDGERSILEVA